MNEAADAATADVTRLHSSMLARDAELIRQVEDIIEMQSQNASTILNGLLTIARRYGYLPSARPVETAQPVAANTPPPLPPGGARSPSYAPAPPMAPHLAYATMNEILDAAGEEARH